MRLVAEDDGTDVERLPAPCRDPGLIDGHKPLHPGKKERGVDPRDAQAITGHFKPSRIHVRSEDAYPAVAASKRLHAFEHRLTVVQGRVARIHLDRSVGDDPGPAPFTVLPLHAEHVIAEDVAEAEVVEVDILTPAP